VLFRSRKQKQEESNHNISTMALRRTVALQHIKIPTRPLSSITNNQLNYEIIGDETSTTESTLYLHGLLGNGRNLRGLAKAVNAPSSILMDLRGHGMSPSFDGPHNFENCAMDVKNTLKNTKKLSTLVGHSFGGRIALEYTHHLVVDDETGRSPPTMWLLDTIPGQANESVEKVLAAVDQVQLTTKKEIVQQLVNKGIEVDISQWLASSVRQTKDKTLEWGFDVDVAQGVLEHFASQDFLGMLEKICVDGDATVHLVRGGKNNGWEEDPTLLPAVESLNKQLSNFHFHLLPTAGHWVHVDDLNGLVQLFQYHR